MNLEFLTSSNDVTITFCGVDITKFVTELSIQEGQTPEGIPSYDSNVVTNYAQAPNTTQIHLGYYHTSDSDDMLNRIMARTIFYITNSLLNGSDAFMIRFIMYVKKTYNIASEDTIKQLLAKVFKEKYKSDLEELVELMNRSNMTNDNSSFDKKPTIVVDLACKNITSKFFHNLHKYYNTIIISLANITGDNIVTDEKIKEIFFMGFYKELNLVIFTNKLKMADEIIDDSLGVIDNVARAESTDFIKYFGVNLFGPSSLTLMVDGETLQKNKILYSMGRFDDTAETGDQYLPTEVYTSDYGVVSDNGYSPLIWSTSSASVVDKSNVEDMITNDVLRLVSVVSNTYLYHYSGTFKDESFLNIIPKKSTLLDSTLSQFPSSKYSNSLLDIGAVNILKQDPLEQGQKYHSLVLNHKYLTGQNDDNEILDSSTTISFPIIDSRSSSNDTSQVKLVDLSSLKAIFLSFNFKDNTNLVINTHNTSSHTYEYDLAVGSIPEVVPKEENIVYDDTLRIMDEEDIPCTDYPIVWSFSYSVPELNYEVRNCDINGRDYKFTFGEEGQLIEVSDYLTGEVINCDPVQRVVESYEYDKIVDVDIMRLLVCEDPTCQGVHNETLHHCVYDTINPNYAYKCSLDDCPKPTYSTNGLLISNINQSEADRHVFINTVNNKIMNSIVELNPIEIDVKNKDDFISVARSKSLYYEDNKYVVDGDGDLTLDGVKTHELVSFLEEPTVLTNTNTTRDNVDLSFITRPGYSYDISISNDGVIYNSIFELNATEYADYTYIVPAIKLTENELWFFKIKSSYENIDEDIVSYENILKLYVLPLAMKIPLEVYQPTGEMLPDVNIYWDYKTNKQVNDIPDSYYDPDGNLYAGMYIEDGVVITNKYSDINGYRLPDLLINSNHTISIPNKYLDIDGNFIENIMLHDSYIYIPTDEYLSVNNVVIPWIYKCGTNTYIPPELLEDGNIIEGLIVTDDGIGKPTIVDETVEYILLTVDDLTFLPRYSNEIEVISSMSILDTNLIDDLDDELSISNPFTEVLSDSKLYITHDILTLAGYLTEYSLDISVDSLSQTQYIYENIIVEMDTLPGTIYNIKYEFTSIDDSNTIIVFESTVHTVSLDYSYAIYKTIDKDEYFGISVDSSDFLKKYKNNKLEYWNIPIDVLFSSDNRLISKFYLNASGDISIGDDLYTFYSLEGSNGIYRLPAEQDLESFYTFGFDSVLFGMLNDDGNVKIPLAYFEVQDLEKTLILRDALNKINSMISPEISKLDLTRVTYESLTETEYNKIMSFMNMISNSDDCPNDRLFFIYDKGKFKTCLHTV